MRPALLFAVSALAALSSAKTVVLGRLGRAKGAAQIYAAPTAKAKVLSHIDKGRYLVVKPGGKNWTTVVMDDHRLAYVPSQAVETLAYEVTEDGGRKQSVPTAPRPGAGYVASRGTSLPRVQGGARSFAADTALSLEGSTPYKWGGTELGSGIDCSGFVKKMYGTIGLNLPRTAAEQATVGTAITNYQDLQKGDRLYFWDAKRGKIGHTGIYLGGGYFVHSSSGHKGIAHDFLSERWRKICVAARR